MVETAERAVSRRHAAAGTSAFFEHRDSVAGLYQRTRAAQTCDTGTDDGEVAGLGHVRVSDRCYGLNVHGQVAPWCRARGAKAR